jgi:hypothetical protein
MAASWAGQADDGRTEARLTRSPAILCCRPGLPCAPAPTTWPLPPALVFDWKKEPRTAACVVRGLGPKKAKKKKKAVQFIRVTEKQAVCAFGIVGGRLDGRGRPARHSFSRGVRQSRRRPCLASVHPSLEWSSMNDELISNPRPGRGVSGGAVRRCWCSSRLPAGGRVATPCTTVYTLLHGPGGAPSCYCGRWWPPSTATAPIPELYLSPTARLGSSLLCACNIYS